MTNPLSLFLLISILSISSVLASEKSPDPKTDESPKTSPPASSAPTDYKIRPLDLVDIRVFQEDDLTMTNKVSQAGIS